MIHLQPSKNWQVCRINFSFIQREPQRTILTADPQHMQSGQTIPEACQVTSEVNLTIPPWTAGSPIRLVILKGQQMPGFPAFFQPLPHFWELNLTVYGTSLLELDRQSAHLLVQNPMYAPVQILAQQPLGMLIDSSFHDFKLTMPETEELPLSLSTYDTPNFPPSPQRSSKLTSSMLSVRSGVWSLYKSPELKHQWWLSGFSFISFEEFGFGPPGQVGRGGFLQFSWDMHALINVSDLLIGRHVSAPCCALLFHIRNKEPQSIIYSCWVHISS